MKRIIERLIELTKVERDAQISAMVDEIKRLSGEKREKKGRAVLGLRGKVVGEELGFKLVRYGRRRAIETEISVGDEVLISKGDPLKSDLRGVVAEKGKRYLVVALESVPEWALRDIRIDLYASDLTYRRWIENLENLTEKGKRALKFAFGFEEPSEVKCEGFTPFDTSLNKAQLRAVGCAIFTDDFFLIHGPFGTGKTRTIAEVVRQLVKKDNKVLVTAESNTAVDNLVELLSDMKIVRIGHPSRVEKKLKEHTLASLVLKHADYKKIEEIKREIERIEENMESLTKPTPQMRRGLSDEEIIRLAKANKGARGISTRKMRSMAEWIEARRVLDQLYEKVRKEEEKIVKEIIEESEVVLSTNSSSFLLEDVLDVAVIDEASQATIPSVLIPINRAKKFVLAGDHKQLPPTVLRAQELSKTLFEMLIERYPNKSQLLEVQYRMNEAIMEFPNREFYGGRIKAHESVKNITLRELGIRPKSNGFWQVLDPDKPVVFIDTSRCSDKWERKLADSTSRYNELECRIVEKLVNELLRIGVEKSWIGVITPYDDQVDLLRRRLDVETSTVDGFQGKEKEVIVVSFVRSNRNKEIGFLEDLRRLNVSLTRAKRKLIMVGDSETLSVNDTYRRLIEHVRRRGFYFRYC
ncbi:IGHMBP2 family helicase [Archaeoglobus sp.]